ncbi:MAG: HAMP domain-containing histidine kinase [Gammaproteobacteria bacterium]|nr:HAMP domain-containing histidine kinase [Gammaproteobacteria bacterium]
MSSVRLADTWRTTTFRLTMIYGAMFAICVVALLSLIYWKTNHYITQQTDHILKLEAAAYSSAPLDQLPQLIAEDMRHDIRHINIYGLFSNTGTHLAGNLQRFPINLPIDDTPHELDSRLEDMGAGHAQRVRMLARILSNHNILVIGRDETQITEIRHILLVALTGSGGVVLIVTLIGFALSIRPIRRIREIQQVSDLIMHGDIHRRLPIAEYRDELDMLAQITNRMLDALERLMLDVKGASDSIAHDLRTPLTRLRALLYRAQTQTPENSINHMIIEQAVAETDALLVRFRALMRISEISSLTRRSGFENLDLSSILQQAQELYAPLADDKNIDLTLSLPDHVPSIFGDGGLLFEAIVNLLDNAIKFTPPNGHVHLGVIVDDQGSRIEVIDSGIGIANKDIQIVTQPFYRSEQAHHLPGMGLGLSIVTAITRLHDFRLTLTSEGHGTCATIECWSMPPNMTTL